MKVCEGVWRQGRFDKVIEGKVSRFDKVADKMPAGT